jgi:hypothetical protein
MTGLKNLILIFAFLAGPATLLSQKLTLDQLRKLNSLGAEDFKNEVKEVHNYSYSDKTETSEFTFYQYQSFVNERTRVVGKFEYSADTTLNHIEYSTTDKEEFVAVMNLLTRQGYKNVGNGKIPGGETYKDYKLNNFNVRLVFPKKQVGNGFKTIDSYTIIVIK